jgi:hypothetical protein
MGLEDLWDDQSITREIYDTISEIEDYDDDRLYDIKSKYEDLSTKMNNITKNLYEVISIMDSIY